MITLKEEAPVKEAPKKSSYTVIGYDLGNNFSQISIWNTKSEEPETVSSVAGTQMYNIPTMLAKRPGVGQWFYGKEAVRYSENEGIPVNDLVKKAERGEEIIVENEAFDPVALLALFVKRSLGLLNMKLSLKDVDAFMFTLEDLSPRMVEVLNKVVAYLQLKCERITYQSHIESFYYYTIHQPREMWKNEVLILEYNDCLKSFRFQCSTHTTPEVVFIFPRDYEDFTRIDWDSDENVKKSQARSLDRKFKTVCERALSEGNIRTVYLLGEGYKEDWAEESLKVLCKDRRVFQGNNLYSRGACYAIMDKLNPSEVAREHVFLGEEKVKSNIGIKVLRRGEDSYFAIIDAGSNWFENSKDFEVILDEGNEISFVLTSLMGGHVSEKSIILDGLPKRPRGTTRLAVHVELSDVNTLEIEIEDLGFGQIVKSSGRAWSQTLEI